MYVQKLYTLVRLLDELDELDDEVLFVNEVLFVTFESSFSKLKYTNKMNIYNITNTNTEIAPIKIGSIVCFTLKKDKNIYIFHSINNFHIYI